MFEHIRGRLASVAFSVLFKYTMLILELPDETRKQECVESRHVAHAHQPVVFSFPRQTRNKALLASALVNMNGLTPIHLNRS